MERSAKIHVVLLSTYHTLRGIGVLLGVRNGVTDGVGRGVGNGGWRQSRSRMPKMEIGLTPSLNVPVLHAVNPLMIQQETTLRSLGDITRRGQRVNCLPRVDGHHASF